MNNPMAILNFMQNPGAAIDGLLRNRQISDNPTARNALEMYKKGDGNGLKQMAENVCKERGTTPEDVKTAIMQSLQFR